jgi:hypothetical protein
MDIILGVRKSRTHPTQLRDEEERQTNLSRFGGSRQICLKVVIGGPIVDLEYFNLVPWFEV